MSLVKQKLHIYLPLLLMALTLNSASSRDTIAQSREDESKPAAPSTGAIMGRVVNENGQPIPHVLVYVNAPVAFAQTRSTTTDDGGNFQVTGLDASIYSIGASAPSYVPVPREPDGQPSLYRIGDSVTISLTKGGVITGTVTSPTGEPMVQVPVRATLVRDANGKAPNIPRFPSQRSTDDRGVYRIYGLAAGTYLVFAGGAGNYGPANNAYDFDAPTYAPSSTRDTAAEVTVRGGEETSGIDIRYRGEAGHAISGAVTGPIAPNSSVSITLMQIINGLPQVAAFSFQPPNGSGFAFYGVGDGDYALTAQSSSGFNDGMVSEPQRVTVKGAEVTGINLALKPLPSISGHLVLESSVAPECRNKRKPLFSETLLLAQRSGKSTSKEPQLIPNFSGTQMSPDKSGKFVLRNLVPGQFSLSARFFAKYWYLRSIARQTIAAATAKAGGASRSTDVAHNGVSLKLGDRVDGLIVTLAEGAASIRGTVKLAEGVPEKLYVYLIPAEKENAEDVLRFFSTRVQPDGTFGINNAGPGRYWSIAQLSTNNESQFDAKLRAPDEADTRLQIRGAAEAEKNEVVLKPCQNVIDYQVPFKILSLKK
jgi:hypothetical protein